MLMVEEALSRISDSSLAYEKYVAAHEPAMEEEHNAAYDVNDALNTSKTARRMSGLSTFGRDQVQQTLLSVTGVLSGSPDKRSRMGSSASGSFAGFQSFNFDPARRQSSTAGELVQRYRGGESPVPQPLVKPEPVLPEAVETTVMYASPENAEAD